MKMSRVLVFALLAFAALILQVWLSTGNKKCCSSPNVYTKTPAESQMGDSR